MFVFDFTVICGILGKDEARYSGGTGDDVAKWSVMEFNNNYQ